MTTRTRLVVHFNTLWAVGMAAVVCAPGGPSPLWLNLVAVLAFLLISHGGYFALKWFDSLATSEADREPPPGQNGRSKR